MEIRLARPEDVVAISPWTSDTFAWGDYVAERMPRWIDDPDSAVLVSVDDTDAPLAVAHVVLLSSHEAWIEGARVHPQHRRKGLGSKLNHAGMTWAAERGSRVIRLAIEGDNPAAQAQVEKLGYRMVSSWVYAEFEVDPTYRASDQYRLRPAPGSDAEAAWLSWAASDLALRGRELIAIEWQWRTARPDDVTGVGELFQSPAGWVSLVQPHEDWITTQWFATTPDGLLALFDGLLDLAASRSVTDLDVKLPNVGWTSEAITRVGGKPREMLIYSKAI